jgi:hypothetical protein
MLGEGDSVTFENSILIPIQVPGHSGRIHRLCKVNTYPKATVDCFLGAWVACY